MDDDTILKLGLPEKLTKEVSIISLIDDYFRKMQTSIICKPNDNLADGDTGFFYCGKYKYTKKFLIDPPFIIFIQLMRFINLKKKVNNNSFVYEQIKNDVSVNLNFTFNSKIFNSETSVDYELVSMVCHTGFQSLQHGHYTAYCREEDSAWNLYDDLNDRAVFADMSHRESNDYKFCSKNSYILCYTKTFSPNPKRQRNDDLFGNEFANLSINGNDDLSESTNILNEYAYDETNNLNGSQLSKNEFENKSRFVQINDLEMETEEEVQNTTEYLILDQEKEFKENNDELDDYDSEKDEEAEFINEDNKYNVKVVNSLGREVVLFFHHNHTNKESNNLSSAHMTINNIYQREIIETLEDETLLEEFRKEFHPELSILETILERNYKKKLFAAENLESISNSKILLLIDADSSYSIIQKYENSGDLWYLSPSNHQPICFNSQKIRQFMNWFCNKNQRSHKIYELTLILEDRESLEEINMFDEVIEKTSNSKVNMCLNNPVHVFEKGNLENLSKSHQAYIRHFILFCKKMRLPLAKHNVYAINLYLQSLCYSMGMKMNTIEENYKAIVKYYDKMNKSLTARQTMEIRLCLKDIQKNSPLDGKG